MSRLYSESAGRFLVSVDPAQAARLEELFQGQPCRLIGEVQSRADALKSYPARPDALAGERPLDTLGTAWQRRFGDLI